MVKTTLISYIYLICLSKFPNSKLDSLDLLEQLAVHCDDEIILDRLVPYTVRMVHDEFPQVRARALKVLTKALSGIKKLPRRYDRPI